MDWKFGLVFRHLDFLLRGAWVTIQVSVASMLVALVLGLLVAVIRLSPWWILRTAASLYIDVLRSTPLLAQLVWIFFALPILTGYALTPFLASTIALSVYTSAYLAEIFRAGILSISDGQRHAGSALGMTPAQVMRRVVLPQGIVNVLPPVGSQLINLFKDSALVSLVSLQDLMWSGQSLASITLRTVEVLTVVAVIYMVLTIPQAMLVNFLHTRFGQH
jgi:polar amino acid transport system permease protein